MRGLWRVEYHCPKKSPKPESAHWRQGQQQSVAKKGRALIQFVGLDGMRRIPAGPTAAPPASREFDRVTRRRIGRMVPLFSIGGDPGIGKSTVLLTSVTAALSRKRTRCAYIIRRGKPSNSFACARSRLGVAGFERFDLAAATNGARHRRDPRMTPRWPGCGRDRFHPNHVSSTRLDSAPGTVTQVRALTAQELIRARQAAQLVTVIHRRPRHQGRSDRGSSRVLEHMVDTVSLFRRRTQSPVPHSPFGVKNRFGPANG